MHLNFKLNYKEELCYELVYMEQMDKRIHSIDYTLFILLAFLLDFRRARLLCFPREETRQIFNISNQRGKQESRGKTVKRQFQFDDCAAVQTSDKSQN